MATGIQLAPPPRRRDPLAESLMAQATDSSPKGHWLAAVAQALQGYVGGKMQRQGREEQTAQEQAIAEALRGQFAGGGPSQTADTRVAPMAAPASLATAPGAPLQPAQDPLAAALMGQPAGQASFQGPAPPPDTRPQAPPLATALRQAGNPMGEAQALAMALMGDKAAPTTSQRDYAAARSDPQYAAWLDRNRSESERAKDAEIRAYMTDLGLPRDQAVRLAYNVDAITTDQQGNRVVVPRDALARGDFSSGQLLNIVGQSEIPQTPQNMNRLSFRDLKYDPAEGTGFWASAKGLWNKTAANILPMARFQDVDRTRRDLVNLQRDLISVYRTGARSPIIELETILGLAPKPEKFMENPDDARDAVAELMDTLGQQYAADVRAANNRMLPVEEQRHASQRATEIRRIIRSHVADGPAEAMLNYYGMPQDAGQTATAAARPAPEVGSRVEGEDGMYEYIGGDPSKQSSWRRAQ